MKKLLYLLLFIFIMSCNSQKKKCEEFKYGTFSIFFDNSEESFFTIDRDKTEQVEIAPDGKKVYYTIEWINECSYIQKFDSKKTELIGTMKMINDDGGIVVELKDIIDNKCITYESYVKNSKKNSLRKGKFCKK